MWKVLLAFVSHRAILLGVALAAVNYGIVSKYPTGSPRLATISELFSGLTDRLRLIPEIETTQNFSSDSLVSVIGESRHPFFWLVRGWMELTQMSAIGSTLLLSNLFFLFFLFETFILLSSMVLLETATWGTLFILVFPSSYEISMGSSLSLTLCLSAVALRRALDNQWLLTGLALAMVALGDWIVVGWLPLFAVLFWFYQRHFQLSQVIKRLMFIVVPLGMVIGLRWNWYSHALTSLSGSALLSLVSSPQLWVGDLQWGQLKMMGPLLSLAIFCIGGILCLASHTTWLNRLVPLYSIGVVLAYSSITTVSVRLLIAGSALSGIAHVSSGTLARVLFALFTTLTAAEIIRIFNGA